LRQLVEKPTAVRDGDGEEGDGGEVGEDDDDVRSMYDHPT